MRILVLTRFYLNGQTTHVLSLCSQLSRFGHQPYLAMANFHHPAYYQWLRSNKIQFTANTSFQALDQLAAKHRFELVHTHSSHTLDLALELGRKHQIPVVATCHYLDFQPLAKLCEADRIISISREMQETLALPVQKTTTIENGVNTTGFKPRLWQKQAPDQPLALIVTRMTDRKEPGYAELVQALRKKGWRIKSVGNWRPISLGLAYCGWQIELGEEYQKADLVIGTGRAIREGMAAGAAALVLGDYLDGIVTEENVELLRRFNFSSRASRQVPDQENIASELDKLTENRLRQLQEFSFHYAQKHFSEEDMAKAVVEVYQSCLA
ncbi:MAG: glycosyltransferase family 4 protein [Firmicutes bacterium]|nr:glycosyltransferase family 4 protein [Bacillota bacterium]NLL88637.1 glycosyltransferase family 4 protein [Bacillota bacterium]HKM16960.1 glycosyltransferase family 4 protein [Limnochordia bacterium]